MSVECIWLEPTDRVRLSLRRYSSAPLTAENSCRGHAHHSAAVLIGEGVARLSGQGPKRVLEAPADVSRSDPRWPRACEHCGRAFGPDDPWQVFQELIYTRSDGGPETTVRAAPPGAMWDAWWYPWKGPDGRSLMVRCPDGHDWSVDSRASNCTLPDDHEHRCWLRTGEPPRITVSKSAPGQRTCSAGGGSIATPNYHGFLRGGRFKP